MFVIVVNLTNFIDTSPVPICIFLKLPGGHNLLGKHTRTHTLIQSFTTTHGTALHHWHPWTCTCHVHLREALGARKVGVFLFKLINEIIKINYNCIAQYYCLIKEDSKFYFISFSLHYVNLLLLKRGKSS